MTVLTLVSHSLCPYVQRAVIALIEKGAAFERITVDLSAEPDWFLMISPLGKVPLLRVSRPAGSTVVLFESNVICEYIEETKSGPKLHPADPLERARHRAWMEFGSAILGDIWGLETTREASVFEAKRRAITAKFGRMEAALSGGALVCRRALQPRRRGVRADIPLLRRIRRTCRHRRIRRHAKSARVAFSACRTA